MKSFLDALETKIIEDYRQDKEVKKGKVEGYYPSKASVKLFSGEVVGECLRKLYYEYTKEPESDPIPLKALYKFGMGKAIHVWFLNMLGKFVETEVEVKFKEEGLSKEIRGRMDGTNKDSILEFKTTWGMGFNIAELPKREHILQARIYQKLTHLVTGIWKRIELVYLARDSANRASYQIEDTNHTELTYDNAVSRWKELDTSLQTKSIPERDFKEKSWQCRYCAFRGTCWNGN